MAFLVILGLLGLVVGVVLLILSFVKRNKKINSLLVILFSFVLIIFGAMNMPPSTNGDTAKESSEDSQTTKSESKKNEQKDRSKFYNIDKIVENSTIGNETMTLEDYEGFAVNAFMLEGAVHKFGLPSHVIGAMEGDETMEVTYPTNEDGYSVGLIFKYDPTGFGDWKLHEKYVVETDGIGFSEYTKP
ncbi:hypothetical protein [Enterococcus entomosocium]|uniref:hypothetical protein n=1 Tax=Enterococcus entomosocium TaxID=3034352 RepID=UPI00264887AC|nr:hypothetical protein [Enterococcus entomosocium]